MKTNLITLFACLIIGAFTIPAFAQDAQKAKILIDQGVALNDSGKYVQAIEKYNEALKANPGDMRASFEMGFTLYSSGKGMDAVPFLEKVSESGKPEAAGAYDLLGSIYDDNKQPDKAIEYYKKGIAANPNYERLHFNLGLLYLRQKRYTESEPEDIAALKLDPKHASAHRDYGLSAYGNNEKAAAVMAFCNFLLLEPQTARSKAVFGYLNEILAKEAASKNITINMDKNSKELSALSVANMSVSLAAAGKVAMAKTNPDSVANLELALKMIFESVGKEAQKPTTQKDFFWNFYADFFYKLAESGNMPAFTRIISLSAYRDENIAWLKENKKQLDDLELWARSTARSF